MKKFVLILLYLQFQKLYLRISLKKVLYKNITKKGTLTLKSHPSRGTGMPFKET